MRVHGVLLTGSSDTSELESSTAPLRNCCSDITVLYESVGAFTRIDYLRAGMRRVPADASVVVFVDDRSVDLADLDAVSGMLEALEDGVDAVLSAIPVSDALKHIQRDEVVGGIDRAELYVPETPQVIRRCALDEVFADHHDADADRVGDPAALLLRAGMRVRILPSANMLGPRLAAQAADDLDGDLGLYGV